MGSEWVGGRLPVGGFADVAITLQSKMMTDFGDNYFWTGECEQHITKSGEIEFHNRFLNIVHYATISPTFNLTFLNQNTSYYIIYMI